MGVTIEKEVFYYCESKFVECGCTHVSSDWLGAVSKSSLICVSLLILKEVGFVNL